MTNQGAASNPVSGEDCLLGFTKTPPPLTRPHRISTTGSTRSFTVRNTAKCLPNRRRDIDWIRLADYLNQVRRMPLPSLHPSQNTISIPLVVLPRNVHMNSDAFAALTQYSDCVHPYCHSYRVLTPVTSSPTSQKASTTSIRAMWLTGTQIVALDHIFPPRWHPAGTTCLCRQLQATFPTHIAVVGLASVTTNPDSIEPAIRQCFPEYTAVRARDFARS